MSDYQKNIYSQLVKSEHILNLIARHKVLAAITMVRKICNHVLTMGEKSIESLEVESIKYPQLKNEKWAEYVERIGDEHIDFLYEGSGKITTLLKLVNNLINENHRILIFCNSVKLLDIVSYILLHENITHCRLDGSIVKAEYIFI